MTGYDYDQGRSRNAVIAEEQGLLLAGTIARLLGRGVKAKHVEAVLRPAEWHHVGAAFQERNYYREASDEEAAKIRSLAAKEKVDQTEPFLAEVQWLEWPRFRPYSRERKRPTVRKLTEAMVTIKGDFATIEHPSLKKPLRKRLDTNGFLYHKMGEEQEEVN